MPTNVTTATITGHGYHARSTRQHQQRLLQNLLSMFPLGILRVAGYLTLTGRLQRRLQAVVVKYRTDPILYKSDTTL